MAATASGPAVVSLEGAVVRYPGREAIGPIDLTVEAGGITALAGASGCGKSTALRLMAGIEAPTEGRVVRRVGKGRTGLVFQSPTLMPWATALDNVALPLALAGATRAEARERAAQALDQVGLGDRLDARPAQLSGGMAMRAALARALVTEPDLLLLDEPFAALDSVTRRALIEDIHRLWAARRPAVVLVTHDVDEAAYMAGRVLVMQARTGRIAAEIETQGTAPRPPGWRADPRHLATVERTARALGEAMGERGAA